MSLPGILVPVGTPAFALDGHGIEPGSPYADVPMLQGEARRRRIYTTAPSLAQVSATLDAATMAAFDQWFEEVLLAGALEFAAELKACGDGVEYWRALWTEPYDAEPLHGGLWRVSGRLLLSGEPSAAPPSNDSLAVEFSAALAATAEATTSAALAVEFGAELSIATPLVAEFGAALVATAVMESAGGAELREDGGLELREDNATELRE